ncbi:aminoacyl-tRNA hydrolase [Alkalimonas collagenimarina]|uniref:Peptidyl-tRNA hydrolase n=1 Tax=Alkalimonas collagenimarina TaxID=400390 RepID=A0ABT9GXX6_9GAMM|nr:aminoacyl-tRNA hydrolase [Alkalimonas collagenimarina]MDP4535540.1 aminoacyl-tRNA hydrolase [Alkalimonas collagenimarina]
MSDSIQLIVGLGNPGPEYSQTRHNAGAWFIEELARQAQLSLKDEPKFYGRTARMQLAGHDIKLLIPTTYMNLSGKAVQAMAQFYKIPTAAILVAHDELALPPGVAKFKFGGGHAGHNGLKDMTSKLGNDPQFLRLRLGIGHPGNKHQVTGYVLGKAPASEQQLIEASIDEAARCLDILLKDGLVKAQSRLHSFQAS